ncbi:MAG: hypothetical protein Q9162_000820 [Coniocarpon cinnabarinum]
MLVKDLLDRDRALFDYIQKLLQTSYDRLIWATAAIKTLRSCYAHLDMKSLPLADIYFEAMSESVKHSKILQELLLRTKLCPVDKLRNVLHEVQDVLLSMPPLDVDSSPDHFQDLTEQLQQFVDDTSLDARTQHMHSKKLTPRDQEYLELRQNCITSIESYFQQAMCTSKELPLNEILFYDLQAPHRDAMTPRIRMATERALSSPQDYLACSCCSTAKNEIKASQPPTSILYQLYLESGSLINVFDLWSAFQSIMQERHKDEQLVTGLFSKSLAELRSMGFIKQSRKKIDHVAKQVWRGL